jgi:CheY-like chemotaxis protein
MAPHPTSFEKESRLQGRRRSLRIVIADDDRDTVMTLTTLLRHEGYETRGVYDGANVERTVADFAADVVLLDISMPGKSGYEIARALRDKHGEACPILIAVTAWNKASDKMLAQLAGFHHHVGKPYEPEQILSVIAKVAASLNRPE